MSEVAAPPLAQGGEAGPGAAGRSLWGDARDRLRANRAARAAVVILAVIVIGCLVGPLLTGHPYDKVYADYVRLPASLSAYPQPDQVRPALERIGQRLRAQVVDIDLADDRVSATLVGSRPIDERALVVFERSDLFGPATVTTRADDGRRLSVAAPIQHNRFLFGTDANGRDLLTRTLIAGRVSLAVGLLATLVALVIGVTWGATAGYLGGLVDLAMMRVVDILYALPFIFFVILLVVFFGRNIVLIFVGIGAVEWLDMARIVRGQTLAIKRREFVQAAEALGVGPGAIIRRHVIPNTLGPVVVYTTLMVPKVILLESFLSFLGLGVQEPMTSWGALIAEGSRAIQGAPWMLVFPALFLTTTLFALNFLGDGLRDALDPRDR
jgi:oligopeptide transport system permease protein